MLTRTYAIGVLIGAFFGGSHPDGPQSHAERYDIVQLLLISIVIFAASSRLYGPCEKHLRPELRSALCNLFFCISFVLGRGIMQAAHL